MTLFNRQISAVILLAAIGVLVGAASFQIYQGLESEEVYVTGEFAEVSGEKNLSWRNSESYGLAPTYRPDDQIYRMMRPNLSQWADSFNSPAYYVETNSEGFRDQEFRKKVPENTTRILVLGDSFTYGWGLNASERYSDITERRLDERFSENIQVVNIGSRSWGIEDYYQVLRHRGLEYNPDIVVIGLFDNDHYSMRDHDRIHRRIREEYNKSDYTKAEWNQKIVPREYQKGLNRITDRPINQSDIYRYSLKLHNLSTKEDFSLLFYRIYPIGERNNRALGKARDKVGIETYRPPEEMQENPDEHSFPGPDGHYDSEAQVLLADKLVELLDPYIRS